ncbi:MAG: cytochrome c [Gammaproteobacteria bacterium]|nr:cytochrome c [Gemmatimonadota bacterium]NIR82441.1 cytochrome c [Gammaproteobacteria bacterium]NIU03577.1 cytochrome c [Gammaproteobacteria bacterium]NIX84851.1 c-type cytochrome [Gammaproteobacteria bacterium]
MRTRRPIPALLGLTAGLGLIATTTAADPTSGEALERGKRIYEQTCVACHGADGKGIVPGAPDLNKKNSGLSKPRPVLVEHVLEGFRSEGSPMAMPAGGGNPDLTEEEARAVVEYMLQRFGG